MLRRLARDNTHMIRKIFDLRVKSGGFELKRNILKSFHSLKLCIDFVTKEKKERKKKRQKKLFSIILATISEHFIANCAKMEKRDPTYQCR